SATAAARDAGGARGRPLRGAVGARGGTRGERGRGCWAGGRAGARRRGGGRRQPSSRERRSRTVSLVERFGVSMDPELLHSFDRLIRRKGYRSRSEAIRDIVRDKLVEEEWEQGARFVVGTVTLVYD